MLPHASLLELLPFTGKGMVPETMRQQALGGVPQNIAGILMNKDWNYDRSITNQKGTLGAYHITKNAIQSFSPDGVDKVYNLIESVLMNEEKRRRSKVINERNMIQQLVNLLGLNVKSYNKRAHDEEVAMRQNAER